MTSSDGLEKLCCEARVCRVCETEAPPLPHRARPVFQVSATARLLIAGQAPGARVHESGRPFTDRSGDRLRDWLGLSSETFYDADRVAILPMGFCFPGYDTKGSDLPPRRSCASLWRTRFLEAMGQVRLTLLVGGYAHRWHLGKRCGKTVSETVAMWERFWPDYGVLPHPSWRNTAWLRRHPWFEDEVLPQVRQRVRELVDD